MRDERYIFWVLGWGTTKVYTHIKFSPLHLRCEINKDSLTITTIKAEIAKEQIRIPLNWIATAEALSVSSGPGGGGFTNLRLRLVDLPQIKEQMSGTGKIYLLPAGVLENPPTASGAEVDIMVEVIEAFKANRQPAIHPNPYYRALDRSGKGEKFSTEKWSATTPPHVYTPVMHIGKFILIVIGIVTVVTISLLGIAGLIFNLFFRH